MPVRPCLVLASLLAFGCATTAPGQVAPPVHTTTRVELTVKELDDDLLKELQSGFAKVPELRSAQLQRRSGKSAVFTIDFPGEASGLPKALARLPHPGLKFDSAVHKVEYSAFDNQPPTVTFVHPDDEQVLNAKEQYVTVDVPDRDIQQVTINGRPVRPFKGSIYRLKMTLNEGQQELIAVAKDKAGNETTAKVTVTVDTTPPALQAQIRLIIEGVVEPESVVLVDGLEVPVDRNGNYRAEIPVRKGQKSVEIVAIDKSGNKNVTYRAIGQ